MRSIHRRFWVALIILCVLPPTFISAQANRKNLESWEFTVEQTTKPPVQEGEYSPTLDDIRAEHKADRTIFTVNTERRPVMVHGIAIRKENLKDPFTHSVDAELHFVITHEGAPKCEELYNGETVQGTLSLYDGNQNVQYSVGWQWRVNAWLNNPDVPGELRYRTAMMNKLTGFAEYGWEETPDRASVKPDTNWHRVQLHLDPLGNKASIEFDKVLIDVLPARLSMPAWGKEQQILLTIEAISVSPSKDGCEAGAIHQIIVRDWKLTPKQKK